MFSSAQSDFGLFVCFSRLMHQVLATGRVSNFNWNIFNMSLQLYGSNAAKSQRDWINNLIWGLLCSWKWEFHAWRKDCLPSVLPRYTQDMQSMDIFSWNIHVIYNFFSTSESKRNFAGIDCSIKQFLTWYWRLVWHYRRTHSTRVVII